MGKPKEQNEHQPLGRKVRFIGLGKDVFAKCHYCCFPKRTGMFVEYQSNLYCNDDCIKMELASTRERN